MSSRTVNGCFGAHARRSLIERIADALYEASLRRTLRAIRAH